MWIICILSILVHFILAHRCDAPVTILQKDDALIKHETGDISTIIRHPADEMLMIHHVSDIFMAHMFAYSSTAITNSDRINSSQLIPTSGHDSAGDDALSQLEQHNSITLFLTTTTMTTVMAHPLNHSLKSNLLDWAVVVAQPDGTSVAHQAKGRSMTEHWIDHNTLHSGGDAILQIHGKPDGALLQFSDQSILNIYIAAISTTFFSATSFPSTTTMTTVLAHSLAQSLNAHWIDESIVMQLDGTSLVHRIEDFLTHRIDFNLTQQKNPITDKLMEHHVVFTAMSPRTSDKNTAHRNNGMNTAGLDIINININIRSNTTSINFGEHDKYNGRQWLYPSGKGRVDTGCGTIRIPHNRRRFLTNHGLDHIASIACTLLHAFVSFSFCALTLFNSVSFFTFHDVLATYTCICISITDGNLTFDQGWNAPFFLQSYGGLIQLESDQGIGLRANNRSDLAADISRSFSILKHRSIFWIILFCVCVCVLLTLFYFLRVAMHDLVLSF